jgi:tungstate transport system permease protein
MGLVWDGLVKAGQLLLSGDREIVRITLLTLKVSGLATLLSVIIGVPLAFFLAFKVFWGKKVLASLVNAGMGLPPVVVGLWVSLFLWRTGPLGFLRLMYTPVAMVIAQTIIALPLVTGFTLAGLQQLNPKLPLQLLALGATPGQMLITLVKEARLAIVAAVMAGFGRVVAEVGASNMVGGNIYGQTRVLTTATMLEVGKGNFALALALSFVLIFFIYGVSYCLTMVQQRRR